MSGREKLFAALSGVGEDLLERSEKGAARPNRWLGWGMALAACLALVFAGQLMLHRGADVPAAVDGPPADERQEGPGTAAAPMELPEGEGQYHFLQFRLDRKQDAPGFSIFVSEESYRAYEQSGAYEIGRAHV